MDSLFIKVAIDSGKTSQASCLLLLYSSLGTSCFYMQLCNKFSLYNCLNTIRDIYVTSSLRVEEVSIYYSIAGGLP